jgi:hypothetical protein
VQELRSLTGKYSNFIALWRTKMYLEEENDDEEWSYDESQNRKRKGYMDHNKEWISEEEEGEEGEEDDEMELTDNQNQQLPLKREVGWSS